ncbi:RagB/SusD family nutrient uptake outer membrane protein [Mariniflexile sp. AS56]|uniref:RagB/SusD family nutrient uptake outer membrane protein n=1 Tax=Mariniflexile sp. AS56 TaxID=3063957 RepID=UPI0026EA1848|nr:RagB/SusD family nutrient uptake outer membrane protein [Mariniflexile sp. AS56]MDO7172352.1 RagB/SusD family nutrient uptake outer membrane protein [Mariniflexile sp. AS56]
MKTTKYTFILIFVSLFFSCEDYLEKVQDFEGLDQDDVFSDIRLAKRFLDGAYTSLISEVSAKSNNPDVLPAMTMAGEGYPGRMNNNVPERYQSYANSDYLTLMNLNGDVGQGQTPNFVSRYFESWRGIRTVNSFLANSDKIINATEAEVNELKGQAYFLRAYFYHLMTKRHGGLLYLKENLNLNNPFDQERETYESNLANMLEDLDVAISLLPVSWTAENLGRPTRGAAYALKSRVTLFGASPLVNTANSQQAWVDAAAAASNLINFANDNGLYTLASAPNANSIDVDHEGADLFEPEPEALQPYRSMFVGPGKSKTLPPEVIFMEVNDFTAGGGGTLVPLPRTYLTTGFDIAKGNNNPMNIGALANFVAKFETKNGLAIENDPSYNPQEPFINRDPRFYNAILFDGVPWTVTSSNATNRSGFADLAIVNEQGNLGLDIHDPNTPNNRLWQVKNKTGYRIRKWIPNGYFLTQGWKGQLDYYANNILFRMGEVYLNYAEAVNEAYGPTGTAPGANLTAIEAINMIRNRVGMPNVHASYTGSKESFRERIRNERAIELCFEGFRYDDIRRWKVAHLDENLKVEFLEMRWQGGTSALYPTGFSFENVEQNDLRKTFSDKNYWWPIPSSEIEAVPTFRQTEGW